MAKAFQSNDAAERFCNKAHRQEACGIFIINSINKCKRVAIGGIFMCIIKNGKDYSVTEYSDKWTVKADSGKLSVAFDVSKSICKTSDELREYVLKNDLF